jgi:hypothetical protein
MDFSFVVNTGDKKRSRWSMEPVASICGMETALRWKLDWNAIAVPHKQIPTAHSQDRGLQKTNQNLLQVHDSRFLDVSCLYWYAHRINSLSLVSERHNQGNQKLNSFLDSSTLNNFLAVRVLQQLPVASL